MTVQAGALLFVTSFYLICHKHLQNVLEKDTTGLDNPHHDSTTVQNSDKIKAKLNLEFPTAVLSFTVDAKLISLKKLNYSKIDDYKSFYYQTDTSPSEHIT